MQRNDVLIGKKPARVKLSWRRRVIAALIVCVFSLSPCVVNTPAHADSRSDLVEAQKRKQEEINQQITDHITSRNQ